MNKIKSITSKLKDIWNIFLTSWINIFMKLRKVSSGGLFFFFILGVLFKKISLVDFIF